MELICESNGFNEYLAELNEVDYSNPVIQEKISELFNPSQTEIEKAKVAFEFVRDEIYHSWDIQGIQVTCNASEVLSKGEGICYAKSNLLAALLRAEGIKLRSEEHTSELQSRGQRVCRLLLANKKRHEKGHWRDAS